MMERSASILKFVQDAVNKWRALGPNVIVAIILLWSYYKGGSTQRSQTREQESGSHLSFSGCQEWSRHASDNLSGLSQLESFPTPCESCIIFPTSTGATKQAWSRPTWMMWLIEHLVILSQGWSAQWSGFLKWVNSQPSWPKAYRCVRVGEASNPGPPSEQGSQASQWPFTPSSQSSSYQEDGAAGPAAPANAGNLQEAPGPAPIALPPTQPEGAPPGPQRQGLPTVLLHRTDGQRSRLSCRYVHSVGAWRWSLPGAPRLTADHRTSPYHGMVQWYDHHASSGRRIKGGSRICPDAYPATRGLPRTPGSWH